MRLNKHGFTIVELMIAITVFSTILLLAAIGITRVSQTYYRGIIQANTQQAARTILDDVAQSIQFQGAAPNNPTPYNITSSYGATVTSPYTLNAWCIGNQRYVYALNYQQSTNTNVPTRQSIHGLWHDLLENPSSCSVLDLGKDPVDVIATDPAKAASVLNSGREMLGDKMRIVKLDITQPAGTALYKIEVIVLYGDDDLFNFGVAGDWTTATCKTSNVGIGSAFCARSELSTVVGKRSR